MLLRHESGRSLTQTPQLLWGETHVEVNCPTSNILTKNVGWTLSIQRSSNWNFVGQMLDSPACRTLSDVAQEAPFLAKKCPVSNVQHPYRTLDVRQSLVLSLFHAFFSTRTATVWEKTLPTPPAPPPRRGRCVATVPSPGRIGCGE